VTARVTIDWSVCLSQDACRHSLLTKRSGPWTAPGSSSQTFSSSS